MRGYCAGKLYAWHNVYRKKWNAKVRNYNLRGSENEMNLKVLNFIEKKKEWLASSTTKEKGDERVGSWLLSLLVIGMCITSSTEMRLNKVCCHLTCVDDKSRTGT